MYNDANQLHENHLQTKINAAFTVMASADAKLKAAIKARADNVPALRAALDKAQTAWQAAQSARSQWISDKSHGHLPPVTAETISPARVDALTAQVLAKSPRGTSRETVKAHLLAGLAA